MSNYKHWLTGGVVMMTALGTTGCRLRASGYLAPPPPMEASVTIAAPPPPSASFNVQVGQPVLVSGVTVVESTCTQGAAEACNGLDDNCNGQIDEGCGYQSGSIQITLSWNTEADIDLYVTDPSGETISYSHTTSGSGGNLDHDARGSCNAGANNRIENVFWNSPQPPRGQYRVQLHHYSDCGTGPQPVTAQVSIAVGGRIYGTYAYNLSPEQRVDVVSFAIP